MKQLSQLHRAATWFARHGLHVFPLRPGRKVPFQGTRGHLDATTSLDQIDKWWSACPNSNIGIACGPSELAVTDFDTDKPGVALDIVYDDDDLVNAVMSKTPSGGTHVWFKQRPEWRMGSTSNRIHPGIDTRGDGGYIVAPPSVISHPADGYGSYTFVDGHRPHEIDLDPQPLHVLETWFAPETPRPVVSGGLATPEVEEIRQALAHLPRQMSYDDWLAALMAVHSALPDAQGIALCEAWSPGKRGEVAQKFASFKRSSGVSIGTLFHMAKQYGYRPPAPVPDDNVRQQLFNLRGWVRSATCARALKERGVRRIAELISALDAILTLGHERGGWRVHVTHRTLAELCDIAPMTAWRRVDKLKEINMLTVEKSEQGSVLDLSPLMPFASDTQYTIGDSVSLANEDFEFQAAHRTDDAFTSYPYWSAVKRRGGVAPLMASLGATGWLLWPHLARGGTLAELADTTGLSVSAVRHTVQKYMSLGLLPQDAVNSQGHYQLVPDAAARLDAVRPHMVTAGVGQMRMGRNHAEAANYAAFRLRRRKHMEPREVMWWENLRDENDRKAAIYFDFLAEQGFDARLKVGKERRIRERLKYDHGEEWRTWGKQLFANYQALGNLPLEDKVRMLTIALVGETNPATFRKVYREMEERIDMMLLLAPKRARWERVAQEPADETPARLGYEQLEFAWESV